MRGSSPCQILRTTHKNPTRRFWKPFKWRGTKNIKTRRPDPASSALFRLIDFIKVHRIGTALHRLGRFTSSREDFDVPRLILLLRIEQTRGGIDLDERNSLGNRKRDDR